MRSPRARSFGRGYKSLPSPTRRARLAPPFPRALWLGHACPPCARAAVLLCCCADVCLCVCVCAVGVRSASTWHKAPISIEFEGVKQSRVEERMYVPACIRAVRAVKQRHGSRVVGDACFLSAPSGRQRASGVDDVRSDRRAPRAAACPVRSPRARAGVHTLACTRRLHS
ncbi:hypothetical protein EON67_08415 [archaeon]|nr:MAG: hypothetical protein EON67_08415 [archaeon]